MAIVVAWSSCLASWQCEAAAQGEAARHEEAAPRDDAGPRAGGRSLVSRQQLVGAWRLATIEYSGPHGATVDPYYQAGSSGIIVYDASGWMSVQITAQNRPKWEVPEVRVPRSVGKEDAASKAEAFDTYYSYYGTWDYDAATSVVTHHVKSSMIPAEEG
ncbi:MAG TPA: lipocalin-like domain-containing protein, partial [Steroidobacteraceae bacterium]|nr:lipocalin-like domain-containing protein [Steroidobacteraceae bacterium]